MSRVVLTYGTFDLFHVGHLNLLKRAKSLGDYLIVGVSTDEFNSGKGKKTIVDFKDRIEIVRSIRYVDEVIAESSWEQKISDVRRFNVNTFVMGDDWKGKFDFLKDVCEVVYLSRTTGISSSGLRSLLMQSGDAQIQEMRKALEIISAAIEPFQ
jgi:glycerol-3-phosphate cytidylyltransferase